MAAAYRLLMKTRARTRYTPSLGASGNTAEAKRLFDLVLDREPDQAEALRGRSTLEARSGQSKQAIIDAEPLVTVSSDNAEDRLILAQAYQASNNKREVLRTLWDAFQDFPAGLSGRSAPRSALASTGDADGARRLSEEFADRKKAKLTKDSESMNARGESLMLPPEEAVEVLIAQRSDWHRRQRFTSNIAGPSFFWWTLRASS